MANLDAPSHFMRKPMRLALAAAGLYFVLAAGTIHFTSNGRDIATAWPANAVLAALMLLASRKSWTTILVAGFVGNALANLITREALFAPVLYGFANLLEVVIVALLMKRTAARGLLRSNGTLVRFLLIAGLLAPAISGVVGAATAWLVFGESYSKAFVTWVLSDSLGLLIFTPIFLAVFRGDFINWYNTATAAKRWEATALLAATGGIVAFIFFGAQRPMLFLVYPPVMLVTFRIGALGTKVVVVLIAVIGGYATMNGIGPILTLPEDTIAHTHMLQAFMAVILLTCLPVAAEVTARARVTEQLTRREEELSRVAVTDSLTGLYNRRGLEVRAHRLFDEEYETICLIAIDVDHFKAINDHWGHAAGDRALQHIAAALQRVTRAGTIVARLGGDEFVLLLRQCTLADGHEVCARIVTTLQSAPFKPDPATDMTIKLSLGIAASKRHDSFEALLGRADEALYRAKRAGRSTIRAAA